MPGENARRRHRNRNRNNNDAPGHGEQSGNNKIHGGGHGRHGGGHGRHGGNHGRPTGDNVRHSGRNDRQVVHNIQERVTNANNAGARPGYQGGPRYRWAMDPATNNLRSVPYYEHMGYDNYSVRTGLPLNGRNSRNRPGNNNGNIQLTWPEFMDEVRRGNGPHKNEGNYEIITDNQRNNPYGNHCYQMDHLSNYSFFEHDHDKVPSPNSEFASDPYFDDYLPMSTNERGPRTPPLESYDQALNYHYEAAGIMGNRDGRQQQAQYGGMDPQMRDEARNQKGRSKKRPNKRQRTQIRRKAQEQETLSGWRSQMRPVNGMIPKSTVDARSYWGLWDPLVVEEPNRVSRDKPTISDWNDDLGTHDFSDEFPDCSDDRSVHFDHFGLFRQRGSPGMEEKQESTSNESSSESSVITHSNETDKELADLKRLIKSFMDITFVRNIMKQFSEDNFEALHAILKD